MSTTKDIESIKAKLLPQSLIAKLPEAELKGLGLLAEEVAESEIMEIDDEYNVHTMYQDVRVTLHVLKSVTRRLQTGNRHLVCSVESCNENICIFVPGKTPATDDCLVFLHLPKYGWRDDMVPRTLSRPMKQMVAKRAARIRAIQARAEAEAAEERARAEAEAAEEKRKRKHEKKKAQLRSTGKEDWDWILSHYTRGYIPDYY